MAVKFKDESVTIQFRDGRNPVTPSNLTQEKYDALVKENANYAALFDVTEDEKPVKAMPKNKE